MSLNFAFYEQPDSVDCGPTCLRMIARHYGRNIPLQTLRDKSQIGKEGVSLLGISEAAEAVGFRTISAKLSLEQLNSEALLPAILHWNQNHFVVLYKIKKNKFFIADPGAGLITCSANDLKTSWVSDVDNNVNEGVALLLEPAPAFYQQDREFEEDENKSNTGGLAFNNIFGYIIPHKKLVFQLLLGLGAGSVLQLILPFLTQSIVDTGINTNNIHFIYIVLFAQLALFAGRMAIEFVRSWIMLHISARINLSVLTDFLIKLMNLPVSFFDSKKTGDIMQRMNDHQRIENFLTGSSLNVLFSLINLLIFSVVLAMFNLTVFITFCISTVLYSGWVIFFLKRRRNLDYRKFRIAAREQGTTIQLVQGMQEIKLAGAEKQMRWAWERLQAKLFRLTLRGLSLNQWQQAGAFFINEGKNILITFLAAKSVIDGHMSLGEMLAVQYMLGQLNSPVEQIVSFLQSWQNAKISMERLNEIHCMKNEEQHEKQLMKELPPEFAMRLSGGRGTYLNGQNYYGESGAKEARLFSDERNEHMADINNAIRLENVSFTYTGAGNEPVLSDITLDIPLGKTTALVGLSGSGKTTLLKLLLKFYEPQKGVIKLGNTSLSAVSHRVWRAHCGTVMQDSFIFSDTITNNITVGHDSIDMSRLQHSVRVANIGNFIEELPLGFNTVIGAEGNGISMGQKQRILIARAVYRNPEFIFFDEATNSLDSNNERIILDNLDSFFRNKTVVIVAHRLSTVKNANQIIVLDKGRIIEKGTHTELISLKGEYFGLVRNQLELGN